jgi:hypothetical protein
MRFSSEKTLRIGSLLKAFPNKDESIAVEGMQNSSITWARGRECSSL